MQTHPDIRITKNQKHHWIPHLEARGVRVSSDIRAREGFTAYLESWHVWLPADMYKAERKKEGVLI